MLINARRVALHCVEFIADVAKGAPAAAALVGGSGRGARCTARPLLTLQHCSVAHTHQVHAYPHLYPLDCLYLGSQRP